MVNNYRELVEEKTDVALRPDEANPGTKLTEDYQLTIYILALGNRFVGWGNPDIVEIFLVDNTAPSLECNP